MERQSHPKNLLALLLSGERTQQVSSCLVSTHRLRASDVETGPTLRRQQRLQRHILRTCLLMTHPLPHNVKGRWKGLRATPILAPSRPTGRCHSPMMVPPTTSSKYWQNAIWKRNIEKSSRCRFFFQDGQYRNILHQEMFCIYDDLGMK